MVIAQPQKPFFTGSTGTLIKIAGVGGLIIAAAGYTFKVLIQRKFREQEFYQKAVDHVMAHKALVNFMGEPLKFGDVDIGRGATNYATSKEAGCEVPISGSRNRGRMHFTAIRREVPQDPATAGKYDPDCEYCKPVQLSPWEIQRIEIAVDNRPHERIVVPLNILQQNNSDSTK